MKVLDCPLAGAFHGAHQLVERQRLSVDRAIRGAGAEPPETGGISATSSPSASTWLAGTICRFTATCTRRSSDGNAGWRSRTQASRSPTVAGLAQLHWLAVAAEALAQDREVQHLDDHRRVVSGRSGVPIRPGRWMGGNVGLRK